MVSVIGEILGSAVAVAISPVPIIAVILMLLSAHASANSLGFLVGWVAGLTVVALVVLAVGPEGGDGEESAASAWTRVVIGVLFLALAVRQWIGRPRAGQQAQMPGWMATIDDFTLVRALGAGLALSAVNPKNLGLTIAAVLQISAAGLSTGQEVAVVAVFVTIASVTIAIPVGLNLVLGERAAERLAATKAWLVDHNSVIMSVLLLVLGATLLGQGIATVA